MGIVKDDAYFENVADRRTKEYKEWKKRKIEGLGDVVEVVTEATGIKKAVKWALGEDCGCDERKEKLNKLFRFRRQINCLDEKEYITLRRWFEKKRLKVTFKDQKRIIPIYNRIFSTNRKPSSCSSCWKEIEQRLKRVFETYEEKA